MGHVQNRSQSEQQLRREKGNSTRLSPSVASLTDDNVADGNSDKSFDEM